MNFLYIYICQVKTNKYIKLISESSYDSNVQCGDKQASNVSAKLKLNSANLTDTILILGRDPEGDTLILCRAHKYNNVQ